MNEAKIRLSAKEMELIGNADIILTKNGIIKKVKLLLEYLLHEQQKVVDSINEQLPGEILIPSPKISKGENYRGLPYLVLDYPRFFDKDGILVIRTMFWWGNFFSCTLQMAGRFKNSTSEKIIVGTYPLLEDRKAYCCINEDAWEHHFEKDNYTLIKKLGHLRFGRLILERPFIKIATKHSLGDWDNAAAMLLEDFSSFMKLISLIQTYRSVF